MTGRLTLPAAVLLLSACAGGTPTAGTAPATSLGSTSPSTAASGQPARPSPPAPVTVDGPCPYLDTGFVQETVGQHIARTTYTTTGPDLPPGCAFYRPDGGVAATIEISSYADPVQAQTAAIELGGAGANPVDDIADGGVVVVPPDQTVLAVSGGAMLLVVTINQESSLEARALAGAVAPLLG